MGTKVGKTSREGSLDVVVRRGRVGRVREVAESKFF